jgi:glycerol-3-phosphate dehydrogenase (NAD(P)+)
MIKQTSVGVLGAGGWGTALAILANRAGSDVTLWTRNVLIIESIKKKRTNESYLSGVFIDPAVKVNDDLRESCRNDMLIIAVPAQALRTLCITMSDMLEPHVPLILACKGIELGSLALMSEISRAILPTNPVAIISGPNFAKEAAEGQPTATTLACEHSHIGERICDAIGGRMFRPYLSDDIIGTQIGGAVKNVIAIACGIAVGSGMGENARAALITRGLAEISRLAKVKGGRQSTLMGLSGMGDLMLTCSSMQSRNMSLGYNLGSGSVTIESLAGHAGGLTEGVATAESIYELSMKLGVSMPICTTTHRILSNQTTVREGITELLSRPFSREENDD